MQRRALEEKEEIGEEERQKEKEGRDRKRRLRWGEGGRGAEAEAEKEINSFVDLLLCCYLKSNAFFSPILSSILLDSLLKALSEIDTYAGSRTHIRTQDAHTMNICCDSCKLSPFQ